MAWQNAEMNRDRKKQRKPFKIDDFYYYIDKESSNLPEPKYGAAALKLIEQKQFPTWALFVFNDLKARANDAIAPELLCLGCDDAIILAPDIDGKTINGMLIAMSSASKARRIVTSPCGLMIDVTIPEISGKVIATEDVDVQINKIIRMDSGHS